MSTSKVALLSLALALATPCAVLAHAPGDLKDAIVGAWSLASIYEEDELGEDLERWGRAPRGLLSVDASGRFMLQLIGTEPLRVASAPPVGAGAMCGSAACLSYAGSYVLDRATIAFTIEDALSSEAGLRATASVTIDESGALHVVSAAEASPTGVYHSRLVWKRATAE
jgi:hypothetical protein